MAWTPLRTVVFPHPFAPTIIVSGLSNSMACSLSGEKALMPRMASFSIWDMVAFGSCPARLGSAFKKLLAAFGAAAASGGLVFCPTARSASSRSAALVSLFGG